MDHPTCAPAHPPNVPRDGDNALKPIGDTVALATKATAELGAMRDAYRAVACVRNLLSHAYKLPKDERDICRAEVEVLVSLVDAEFERRMQITKATIALMPVEASGMGRPFAPQGAGTTS